MLTYHLVATEDFDPQAAEYLPATFTDEGFVHTTWRRAHLHEVANRYYRSDPRPYLLLTIDLDKVTAPWRYDAAGTEYPHIYGPICRRAIVATHSLVRTADGTFLPVAD